VRSWTTAGTAEVTHCTLLYHATVPPYCSTHCTLLHHPTVSPTAPYCITILYHPLHPTVSPYCITHCTLLCHPLHPTVSLAHHGMQALLTGATPALYGYQ
jgi:hypothetical protein